MVCWRRLNQGAFCRSGHSGWVQSGVDQSRDVAEVIIRSRPACFLKCSRLPVRTGMHHQRYLVALGSKEANSLVLRIAKIALGSLCSLCQTMGRCGTTTAGISSRRIEHFQLMISRNTCGWWHEVSVMISTPEVRNPNPNPMPRHQWHQGGAPPGRLPF